MIYKAIVVIWIFGAGGRVGRIEGILRGPRGPKNILGNGADADKG